MRILGIDTSGKTAAVALLDSNTQCLLGQQVVVTKQTHSQVILPMAERLRIDCGLTWQEIDGLAAACGPGSYTGLRIGIAAVQAMAFALDIPCAGISTLAGLAWQNLSWQGLICSVMHARQTLLYAGIYRSDGKTLTTVQPDGMLEQAALQEQLEAFGVPVLIAGDGTDALAEKDFSVPASPSTRLQNGVGICLGAAALDQWQTPDVLMPEYLQLVKAEKDLQHKRNQNLFA